MHEYYITENGAVICAVGEDAACGIHDLPASSELPEEGAGWQFLFETEEESGCLACGRAVARHYDTGIRLPKIPVFSAAI